MRVAKKIMRGAGGVLLILLSLVLIVAIVGGNWAANTYGQMLMIVLGDKDYKVSGGSGTEYYPSDYGSGEELLAYEEEVCKQIEAEGLVLLRNEKGALPLNNNAHVSLIGQDSVDLVYGGAGSGSVDTSKAPDMKTALESCGVTVNPVLWDFYDTGAASSYRKETTDVTGQGGFAVNEVPRDVYTEKVVASFDEYSDAAILFVGRSGGESHDIDTEAGEEGTHYLQLTPQEQDMIELANEHFDKLILIVNANNPMELGFIEEYGIDACIWVGGIGQTGAYAVAEALAGIVNPSGALVDTYAYDSKSAPSIVNFGDYTIENSPNKKENKYMVYAEGIYVGYRYYETRYEDVVLGNESVSNYDYSTQVQYPFGYGLSYTEFEWSNYSVTEKNDTFEVMLTVQNTGEIAGKEIVQIYLQSPYTEYDRKHGIEKPSVELVGFEKTQMLEPGETEQITIAVEKENLKVYDADGEGSYIVDAGNYYLAAGENAHDALNNILAAKGKTASDGMDADGNPDFTYCYNQMQMDMENYRISIATGNEITNQFVEADIRFYDPDFTYLSRSDWSGTWPVVYSDGTLTAGEELLAGIQISFADDTSLEAPGIGVVDESYGRLSAADLIGVDYNDARWDALVSQMSLEEMHDLVRRGGYATQTVESINLPGTIDKDGPAGISSTLVGGTSCMAYPTEVVWASTWNRELTEGGGRLIGEDSLKSGVTVWYAPAMNIHRSPFSGRNFEYYSEDGFLSAEIGAAEVKGAVDKGVIATIKHFALNDQECNRAGLLVFANEQSVRQLYLRGFEGAVREGNANGVMVSMNRIGARWSGGHAGLMTETLRNEWGFQGLAVTDQASFPDCAVFDLREGLEAGTDLWLNSSTAMWKLTDEQFTPAVIANLHRAAKNVVYNVANSNAMNGISADAVVKKTMRTWRILVILLSVILAILAVLCFYRALLCFGFRKEVRAKKMEEKRQKRLEKKMGKQQS